MHVRLSRLEYIGCRLQAACTVRMVYGGEDVTVRHPVRTKLGTYDRATKIYQPRAGSKQSNW